MHKEKKSRHHFHYGQMLEWLQNQKKLNKGALTTNLSVNSTRFSFFFFFKARKWSSWSRTPFIIIVLPFAHNIYKVALKAPPVSSDGKAMVSIVASWTSEKPSLMWGGCLTFIFLPRSPFEVHPTPWPGLLKPCMW